ncbi:MAG: GNAT family N-acetyltransferase [Caldimonas sp.]
MRIDTDPPMRRLETARLVLEPLSVAHAAEMFDVLAAPSLHRYIGSVPPPSVADLRQRYLRLEGRRSPDGRQRWLNWILRRRDGRAIGFVQATVNAGFDAWVAWLVSPPHQRHGYAAEATRTMLDELAGWYAVRRCLATVEVENEASTRLLAGLGFSPAESSEPAGRTLTPSERLYVRSLAGGA